MLAYMEQINKLERVGSFAVVYNAIVKKNANFQNQINQYNSKKKKKISEKARLFSIAVEVSMSSWDECSREAKGLSISAGTVISNLYLRNEEGIKRIYGIKEKDMNKIAKLSELGVTLVSSRVAGVLMEKTKKVLSLI